MTQNDNEKIYNCQCGAAFATLKELDKHITKHIKVPLNLIFLLLD
jgi:hypothetical protein